jgi:hypothetical protein
VIRKETSEDRSKARTHNICVAKHSWNEKLYIREGDAAGTVADLTIPSYLCEDLYHSAYWHGALYVRCEEGFALRYVSTLQNPSARVSKNPHRVRPFVLEYKFLNCNTPKCIRHCNKTK